MEVVNSERNTIGVRVGVFAVLAFLITAVLAVNGLRNVVPSQHALQKHGTDAEVALEWVRTFGKGWHRWDCRDGRTRWIVPMDDGRWAIAVFEGSVNITAFITGNKDYVLRIKEGCQQWQNVAHP